ncbi:MAG: tyrosine-type recombinase/integrase [Paludibacteraceae bacterium]|nr:tyrosine-type recombinase/integrase [Paludibacteraceae bacterium]
MPTLKFRISSRVYNGQAEVLARFYAGTFSQRAKTHIPVPVAAWNEADGCLSIPRKMTPEAVALRERQQELDELTNTVLDAWWRDQYDAGDGWLQQTIDEARGINASRRPARRRLYECVMEYPNKKNLEPATAAIYEVIARDIQRFEEKHGKLYTDTFTADDAAAFVRFLMNEKGESGIIRGRNTIVTRMKKLRAACKEAVRIGEMRQDPFGLGGYKIPREVYGTPTYLTLDERNALYEISGLSPSMAAQRDIFIFQCHVGCRVSDLIELREDNVTEDGFLQYIARKTRKGHPVVVRVPLSDTALEIVSRYKGQPDGRLLPFVDPIVYNRDIHKILKDAGMDRVIMVQDPKTLETKPKHLWEIASSHIARRTFMMHIFKETGSERITSSFTGHADGSRAFARYTDVDDEMKLNVLKRMAEKK